MYGAARPPTKECLVHDKTVMRAVAFASAREAAALCLLPQ